MSAVRAIPVRDERGEELVVYEFQDRRFLRNVRRLRLCTGEAVQRGGGAFFVVATGDRLTPFEGSLE